MAGVLPASALSLLSTRASQQSSSALPGPDRTPLRTDRPRGRTPGGATPTG